MYNANIPWVGFVASDIALFVEVVVSFFAVVVEFALVLNWEPITELNVRLSAVDAVIVADDDAVSLA